MALEPIDPSQYLGLEYNTWKNNAFAYALSNPTAYFKLKSDVESKLKKAMVKQIYNIIYGALNDGKDTKGDSLFSTTGAAALNGQKPQYPLQKIQKLSLDASATMEEEMNKILNILFPSDFNEIFAAKLNKEGKQSLHRPDTTAP